MAAAKAKDIDAYIASYPDEVRELNELQQAVAKMCQPRDEALLGSFTRVEKQIDRSQATDDQ